MFYNYIALIKLVYNYIVERRSRRSNSLVIPHFPVLRFSRSGYRWERGINAVEIMLVRCHAFSRSM